MTILPLLNIVAGGHPKAISFVNALIRAHDPAGAPGDSGGAAGEARKPKTFPVEVYELARAGNLAAVREKFGGDALAAAQAWVWQASEGWALTSAEPMALELARDGDFRSIRAAWGDRMLRAACHQTWALPPNALELAIDRRFDLIEEGFGPRAVALARRFLALWGGVGDLTPAPPARAASADDGTNADEPDGSCVPSLEALVLSLDLGP